MVVVLDEVISKQLPQWAVQSCMFVGEWRSGLWACSSERAVSCGNTAYELRVYCERMSPSSTSRCRSKSRAFPHTSTQSPFLPPLRPPPSGVSSVHNYSQQVRSSRVVLIIHMTSPTRNSMAARIGSDGLEAIVPTQQPRYPDSYLRLLLLHCGSWN